MNKLIIEVFDVKQLAGCSYISVFIPIGFDLIVNACNKHKVPEVELSSIVEEGSV